jgi:hypothetical protein
MQQFVLIKQQSARVFLQLNQAQELHWLSDVLRSRVRMAGFTPCRRLEHLVVADTRAKAQSLAEYEFVSQPHASLTLRRMHQSAVRVLKQISPTDVLIESTPISIQYPIMLADCEHAEVHTLADATKTPEGVHIQLQEPILFTYQLPFYYAEWVTESFFMRQTRERGRALFYQYHRVDQLTRLVQDFSAKRFQIEASLLVELNLQLSNQHSQMLVTRIRAP